LNFYRTDGVLIAYNNVKIVDRVGRILDEAPYIHFNIQADFIVFKPTVGCRLKGVVNKKSPNHVGCLVHRCFNASVHKPHDLMVEWQGSHLQLGEEFVFEVKKIFVHNGVMSLRGILCNERFV
jgi:DNA-directed RNA polymerase I subunit RPA43